jgi:hypothetical protein
MIVMHLLPSQRWRACAHVGVLALAVIGTILGCDAVRESMTSSMGRGVYDVWGFENYQAVAVSDSGTILRFDAAV